MYLGIDLGTSGVKAVLCDEQQRIVDQASAPLDVSRPRPHWSEQQPEDWWRATETAIREIGTRSAKALSGLRGIGLSGQMHGATLLDREDRVLRPAILWNDGRSAGECRTIEAREPRSRAITGNLAMPGFTAPKLAWVKAHEPETFARIARVLLPKDYLRLCMTGEAVSEMSDASGTLWLDVGGRRWSAEMLAATDLNESAMPRLVEGTQPSARLKPGVAVAWGVPPGTVVAGGGGDNAAGAVGVGVVAPGDAFLSIGTSGVLFVATDAFRPDPDRAVHAFCHALPGTWHQMSVILSAASSLSWLTRALGEQREAALLAEAGQVDRDTGDLLFLPYLSGERTPHNDADAQGAFVGLTHSVERADLTRAVLEGVAFAFADGLDVLTRSGTTVGEITVIGGGARSPFWGRIIAAALDRPLVYRTGADVGPAFGAARLGRLAATGEPVESVSTAPPVDFRVEPDPELVARYKAKLERYRELYRLIRPAFRSH